MREADIPGYAWCKAKDILARWGSLVVVLVLTLNLEARVMTWNPGPGR